MNERARIALELINVARELVASDYVHKRDYTDADEEERYANELAMTVYDHFRNGRLDEKAVDYTLKVSPKRYLKRDAKTDAQRKSYEVRIVMFYREDVNPSDMPCKEALNTLRNGSDGEAYSDDLNNLVIVISGYSDDDWCDALWFKETFVHEMMHILDRCAYNYAFSQTKNYGKLTKHEYKRNLSVPYPVGNDDLLDPKFAEYFTCENEMREYRSSLRNTISHYCEATDTEWADAIVEIRKALESKTLFIRYYDSFIGDVAPLATLYHLCFSRTSHGNRQTAMKLLDGLQEPED